MPEADGPDLHASRLRTEIRDLIRSTRRDRNISQAELGSMLGSNRFLIIRIEKGERDVTLDEARSLDQALDLDKLADLVAQLHEATGDTGNQRDHVVRELLQTPALESVTIVVADDLNVFGILFDKDAEAMRLDAREIRVVFPTFERERVLFGGSPLWGFWEQQIKRLAALQAWRSGHAGAFQVYESDEVTCSIVTADTRTGTQTAFWPSVPVVGPRGAMRIEGSRLPVVTAADTETIGRLRAHVEHLLAGREHLRTNEALCRFDNNSPDPTFTRYFAQGIDEEEDVAENEGLAVSLVLATARCPRKHYGVGRRVVVYKRPSSRHDRGMVSLFSNPVDDSDIDAARAKRLGLARERGRSTRGALAATLDTDTFLSPAGGVIPDLAFQISAARELAMFGLVVEPERLREVKLPSELRLVRKPDKNGQRRAAIAPKLFILELEPAGPTTELDVLFDAGDSEVVGIEDIAESDQLNGFLAAARTNGFLIDLLERLGVARR
ncbi:helix-turn-helix transcriptional regulator [Actinoplanes sp. NPDC051470]|uniref:helix-turn-helix transcriptional regulator n=1 Tax=Actinoplanes sp. NPDC051470 TaxID=3157224 RepID=UPI00343D91E4